ncbi:hypothetical protein DES52_1225 [Deinococcus yavapaiensis KR-236]|uniref:Uncharacterized protein n=1 Tax=Deinococcus yavapaiensis KR-236 TaxID=694435 RepID=A0A318S261_9DEIO|nr:hypothetical protein DES52_1225 [Deinococcus yavapaiensis KR-236]
MRAHLAGRALVEGDGEGTRGRFEEAHAGCAVFVNVDVREVEVILVNVEVKAGRMGSTRQGRDGY